MSTGPNGYRTTLLDRRGPDAIHAIRAGVLGAVFTLALGLTASLALGGDGPGLLRGALLSLVAGAVVGWVTAQLAGAAAGSFRAFIQPSGRSTPYERDFSLQLALEASGDVDGALASFDALLAAQPLDVEAHVAAAEFSKRTGRHDKAAELFRAVRRIPGVPPARDRYATQRLIDLLLGPLDDRGRALVELRRLADRHPGTTEARHALEVISRFKHEATEHLPAD